MSLRFAFAGFRHDHILSLLAAVQEDPDLRCVAACEEDPARRAALADSGKVAITHDHFERMLAETDCDVVAVGDYYARRGPLAIRALEAGRHVISDKPICTRLSELDTIERLTSDKGLAFGCQLDLRGAGVCLAARKLMAGGAIGDVQTVLFTGQHPLMFGRRPDWYFQEGSHGGTINDIFIHAADGIEWLTGRRIAEVSASRTWNSSFPQVPHFQVGAQLMLKLDNQGGALGDVSYLAPERCGYSVPPYWRFSVHGTGGWLEFNYRGKSVLVATHADDQPREIPAEPDQPHAYLGDFLKEVRKEDGASLTTRQVLRGARIALTAQRAADERLTGVPCGPANSSKSCEPKRAPR